MKAKLKVIYGRGKELFPDLSDNAENEKRRDWYKAQYELLGVSRMEWITFRCDTLGVLGIF
jgi:hypothetical protein